MHFVVLLCHTTWLTLELYDVSLFFVSSNTLPSLSTPQINFVLALFIWREPVGSCIRALTIDFNCRFQGIRHSPLVFSTTFSLITFCIAGQKEEPVSYRPKTPSPSLASPHLNLEFIPYFCNFYPINDASTTVLERFVIFFIYFFWLYAVLLNLLFSLSIAEVASYRLIISISKIRWLRWWLMIGLIG